MEIVIEDNKKILVVAPHADDESIGCGGLISLYGKQCDLLLLTDGRKGHTTDKYKNENELVSIRKLEFKRVAEIADVNKIHFLDIEDGTVKQSKKKVCAFDIKSYDYIFVPNRYESHTDHKAVFSIIRTMKRKQHSKAVIFEYEVWTPLRHPTWFLDISSVVEKKKQMITQYTSQLADIDYVQKGLALSCYRGMFNNTEYTEAFLYSNFSGIKSLLYSVFPNWLKEMIKKVIINDVCK